MKKSDEKLLKKLNLTDSQKSMAIATWQKEDEEKSKFGFWIQALIKLFYLLSPIVKPAMIILFVCIWQGVGDQGTLQVISAFTIALIWVCVNLVPFVLIIAILISFIGLATKPETAFGRKSLRLLVKRPFRKFYYYLSSLLLIIGLILTGHIATAVGYFIASLIILLCGLVFVFSVRAAIKEYDIQKRENEMLKREKELLFNQRCGIRAVEMSRFRPSDRL